MKTKKTTKELLFFLIMNIVVISLLGYTIRVFQYRSSSTIGILGSHILLGYVVMLSLILFFALRFPQYFTHKKRARGLFGAIIIRFSSLFFIDNPQESIYFRDTLIVLGLIICIAGFSGLFTPKTIKEAKEMKDVEIIEV